MRKFAILLLLSGMFLNAYSQDIIYRDLTRRVFWFDISVKYVTDKETGLKELSVYPLGAVRSGNVQDFDKHLWSNLSSGRGIAVGPFNTKEEAERAIKFYKIEKAKKDSALVAESGTFYWYLVKIKRYKRMRSLDFERIPARVASGNLKNFLKTIEVSLPLDKVAIGPFLSQEEAEESKRLFRLEE